MEKLHASGDSRVCVHALIVQPLIQVEVDYYHPWEQGICLGSQQCYAQYMASHTTHLHLGTSKRAA